MSHKLVDVDKGQKALKPFHEDFKVIITSVLWHWHDCSNDFDEHIGCRQGWFPVDYTEDRCMYTAFDPELKFAVVVCAGFEKYAHLLHTLTAWNEAYIMLVSCIDYALDMTCIQSVSQCFIVGGIL